MASRQRSEKAPVEPASATDLERLGEYALRFVKPGQTVGLGTGRAATAFIRALIDSHIQVRAVGTSKASEELAREAGVEVASLDQASKVDVTLDGADEVDAKLNLIKGYGGALVREKIVAAASRRRIMLVGVEKLVHRLGEHGRLPVEVVPFGANFAARCITRLGLKPVLRQNADSDNFITDNGNFLLDCATGPIVNARRLERELLAIPGVVGTGLFIEMADVVLVAEPGARIRTLKRT